MAQIVSKPTDDPGISWLIDQITRARQERDECIDRAIDAEAKVETLTQQLKRLGAQP